MVTADNNNKFYHMTPQGDTILVEFGRVGATAQKASYPLSRWDSLYRSKVKKGYKDVTGLVKASVSKREHKPISDLKIQGLFDKLFAYAKKSVRDNYTISSEAVTAAQVAEAQAILDELTKLAAARGEEEAVKKALLSLYTIIPRRMTDVRLHLVNAPLATAAGLDRFRSIIDNEQKTLDVMAGQVQMQVMDVTEDAPEHTVLEALGIQVAEASGDAWDRVRMLMGSDVRELRSVYRVVNNATQSRYDTHMGTVTNTKNMLFWHGSRNENWISILQAGLKIRPSNAVLTGSMFGDGIYFADKYRKSANYTSLRGAHWTGGSSSTAFLSLMSVHVGSQYEILRHTPECYRLSADVLRRKGNYDSVFAKGGADLRNNEYIVYHDAQSTIQYLVEVGN